MEYISERIVNLSDCEKKVSEAFLKSTHLVDLLNESNLNELKEIADSLNKDLSNLKSFEFVIEHRRSIDMKRENEEIEFKKNLFLQEFKREQDEANSLFTSEGSGLAQEIVNLLKTKELTYEEAYAVLQLTYKQLKYESNFLILI